MPIRWTSSAARDLTQISDYTQERFSPAQARKTALAIYDAAESLNTHTYRGRPGRKAGTRELVISGLPFVIIYRTNASDIEIIRILHGAQKWP